MSVDINDLVQELSALPEQGSASMRLLAVLNEPEAESRDIAAIIEADPSMTARLLTLANSAFFAVRTPAANAWSALMVVGFNVVRTLVTSGALGLKSGSSDMPEGYFDHALASAAGASAVARDQGVRASDAFSAALLHDIGGALLFRNARNRWLQASIDVDGHLQLDPDRERAAFGATHDQLGSAVLEHLHFPGHIVDVVREHQHHPDDIGGQLTRIVVAGVCLAEQVGHRSTTAPISDPEAVMGALGYEVPAPEHLVESLAAEIDSLRAVLR